jgi:hypothetical protein
MTAQAACGKFSRDTDTGLSASVLDWRRTREEIPLAGGLTFPRRRASPPQTINRTWSIRPSCTTDEN